VLEYVPGSYLVTCSFRRFLNAKPRNPHIFEKKIADQTYCSLLDHFKFSMTISDAVVVVKDNNAKILMMKKTIVEGVVTWT
jgi:hypothetical protein